MTSTRVLLMRHGETDWNVASRLQGQLDVPLNERGRDQARRLADALAAEPIAAVYSSDLLRASVTAGAIGERLGLPVRHELDLRERAFGVFEGWTHDEVEERWPLENRRWRGREAGFAPTGGETLHAFHRRSVAVAARLAARHAGETIVLVAHGGVLDCLYRAALRIALDVPRTWKIGNASVNVLDYRQTEGFSMLSWGDDGHLAHSLDESNETNAWK